MEKRGLHYKILKFLNPWLRKPYLNNYVNKEYNILLLEKGIRECDSSESEFTFDTLLKNGILKK